MNHEKTTTDAPGLAAFYGRASGDDDESIATQLAVCLEKAGMHNCVIPDSRDFRFTDVNVTGVLRIRDEFDRLKAVIERGAPFKYLFVRNRARLGRWADPRRILHYEVLFEDYGVRIIYADGTETTYSEGVSDSQIGTFVSEAVDIVRTSRDRTELRKKFRTRKRDLVALGYYPSGTPPYGYMLEEWDPKANVSLGTIPRGARTRTLGARYKLVPADDGSAERLQWVFHQLEAGRSLMMVAKELNRLGVPTPSGAGNWSESQLSIIVRKPIYMGTLVWGGKGLTPEEALARAVPHHEARREDDARPIRYDGFVANPLVTKEQFEAVRASVSKRAWWHGKRRNCAPRYLLTGRLACAACGRGMAGQRLRSGSMGRTLTYYVHTRAANPSQPRCPYTAHTVRADMIEAAVVGELRNLLLDPHLEQRAREELRRLAALDGGSDLRREVHNAEIALRNAQRKEKNLLAAIENAMDDAAVLSLTERLKEATGQLNEAGAILRQAEARQQAVRAATERELSTVEAATPLADALLHGSTRELRAVIERVMVPSHYDFVTRTLQLHVRLDA